jgi:hypothetical protein
LTVATIVVASLAFAASASARISIEPGVFDPGHLGTITSKWKQKAGLPETDAGGKRWGLLQGKEGALTDNASAFATVKDIKGSSLAGGLGFAYNGHCGAGAPRFNIKLKDGSSYFGGGCANGLSSLVAGAPAGWFHVEFSDANVLPADASSGPWPGFGNVEVKRMSLLFDEVGQTTLDNIRIGKRVVGAHAHKKHHRHHH